MPTLAYIGSTNSAATIVRALGRRADPPAAEQNRLGEDAVAGGQPQPFEHAVDMRGVEDGDDEAAIGQQRLPGIRAAWNVQGGGVAEAVFVLFELLMFTPLTGITNVLYTHYLFFFIQILLTLYSII